MSDPVAGRKALSVEGNTIHQHGRKMPKVTVGVPVYNSSSLLAECLDCLLGQTFVDIEILIFDNASIDATPDIVRAYAKCDARIKYVRQAGNVGPLRNFLDVLEACQSEYFCWRAHDDLSSLDFLEKLYAALEANPQAGLALGRIASSTDGGALDFSCEIPSLTGRPMEDIRRQLRRSNGCALYGLWRTETVRPLFREVVNDYVAAWASDHLLLSSVLLKRSFVLVPDTTFIQRNFTSAVKSYSRPDLATMRKLRRIYYRIVRRHINQMDLSPADRLRVRYYAWLSLGNTVFMFRRIVLHTLRAPVYRLFGR